MDNTDEGYRKHLNSRVPGKGLQSDYPAAVHDDYKNADLYTDHGNDLIAWSWEFLRRNPRYQYLTDQVYMHGDKGHEGSSFELLAKDFNPWYAHWTENDPRACLCRPPFQGSLQEKYDEAVESHREAKRLLDKATTEEQRDKFRKSADDHLADSERYRKAIEPYNQAVKRYDEYVIGSMAGHNHIQTLFDSGAPIHTRADAKQFAERLADAADVQEWRTEARPVLSLFAFDLEQSIVKQLSRAKDVLEAQQGELQISNPRSVYKPKNRSEFIEWLRVLDADAKASCGAKMEVLKAIGYKNETGTSKYDRLLKRAHSFRNATPEQLLLQIKKCIL